jgi:hypothetical protein
LQFLHSAVPEQPLGPRHCSLDGLKRHGETVQAALIRQRVAFATAAPIGRLTCPAS